MDDDFILNVGRRMLETALLLAAPVLITTLLIGLVVSILQAITSIRDTTIGLVLKLGGVGVTLLVFGGWMMRLAVSFTTQILNQMQSLTR